MLQNLHSNRRALVARARWRIVLISLAACVACSSGEPVATVTAPSQTVVRDRTASFQTDELNYQLRAGPIGYEVEIGVVFTNLSPATGYFANCSGATALTLEKFEGGNWVTVWSPILPACLSPPVIVQPLTSARMNVAVFAGYPGCSCSPKFTTSDPTGLYHIVWSQLYGSYNSGTLVYSSTFPVQMRVSNDFYMTAQAR